MNPAAGQPGRQGLLRRGGARLAAALPGPALALIGSLLWAAVNAATAAIGLWLRDWQAGHLPVVTIFAAGAALAFVPALALTRLAASERPRQRRFAAALLTLAVLTIAATAALFALQYRVYYAQWHADFPSVTWGFQLFFTTAAAVYQFAVLGLRLYFPLGFVALFIASAWIAGLAR